MDAVLALFAPGTEERRAEIAERVGGPLGLGCVWQRAGEAAAGLERLEREAQEGTVARTAELIVAVFLGPDEELPALPDLRPPWRQDGAAQMIILRLLEHLPAKVPARRAPKPAAALAEYLVQSSDCGAIAWILFTRRSRMGGMPAGGCYIAQSAAWDTAQAALIRRLRAKLRLDLEGDPEEREDEDRKLDELTRDELVRYKQHLAEIRPAPKISAMPVDERALEKLTEARPAGGWRQIWPKQDAPARESAPLSAALRELFGSGAEQKLRVRIHLEEYLALVAQDQEAFLYCWLKDEFRRYPLRRLGDRMNALCLSGGQEALREKREAEERWDKVLKRDYRLNSDKTGDWDNSLTAGQEALEQLAQAGWAEIFWEKMEEKTKTSVSEEWKEAENRLRRQMAILDQTGVDGEAPDRVREPDWGEDIEKTINIYRQADDGRIWAEAELNRWLNEFTPLGSYAVYLDDLPYVCLFANGAARPQFDARNAPNTKTRPVKPVLLPEVKESVLYALALTPFTAGRPEPKEV
jgi:hypothetical protein